MTITKEELIKIDKKMWFNITTENLIRKWQRRLIVALTETERQKCIFNIRYYKAKQKES